MKSIINYLSAILSLFMLTSSDVIAQLNTPRVSPKASVSQTIGMTDIAINYSRPNVTLNGADRTKNLWGQVVPYGLSPNQGLGTFYPWRAGANENTTISFSDDVKVQGNSLGAGTYGLHMIIEETGEVIIIFSRAIGEWGSFSYDESKDALRVKSKLVDQDQSNLLTYSFQEVTQDKAKCLLQWGNKQISFEIEVNTNKLAFEKIENQLKGFLGFSWQGYNTAANYCITSESNYDKGHEWLDLAILTAGPNYSLLMTRSKLFEKEGKADESEVAAKQALDMATYRELFSYGDTKLQTGDIQNALNAYTMSQRKYDASSYSSPFDEFILNVRQAQVYQQMQDIEKALNHAKKAQEVAPNDQYKALAGQLVAQLSNG